MRSRARILVSVAMIVAVMATGVVGVALSSGANHTAQALHSHDRQQLQGVLATLTTEYLLLAYQDEAQAAAAGPWSLQPNDAGDLARLKAFSTHSPLLTYGAAIVGLSDVPLTELAPQGALPVLSNPGYAPLTAALATGGPAVSSAMRAGPATLVAMAAPITVGSTRRAVLIGYFRADTSTLEAYASTLHLGRTGQNFVLDPAGNVVAATDRSQVGTAVPDSPALAAVRRGQSGFVEYRQGRSQLVASYAPVALGGWSTITVENASEFFGPLQSSHRRVETALLALLALAAAAIAALAFKQERSQQRYNRELSYQAAHDPLTGLCNRAVFTESLGAALARARRQHSDVGLLYLDLDGFKKVNDTYGHEVGDALLIEVGHRVRACVREGDLVARMGGDEFTILMERGAGVTDSVAAAERVVAEIVRPFAVAGVSVEIGGSVGIAWSHEGRDSSEGLLREADLAMYEAKDGGRGCWRVYADALQDRTADQAL